MQYLQYNCWPRLNSCWLKYVETFSISQELDSGCLYSVVSAGLWLKPSGARLVWSSFNEGSDKGNDERALMRLHDLSQLLAFYTLLRWPQTPCHQAHTCRCACHELLSFDFGRRVDPVRFSLIFRFPMAYGADVVLQQFAFGNAAALRIGPGISFLAEQTLFPSQPTAHEKGSLQSLQCQGISDSTGQRNSIWAFWSSLAYFLIWAQQWNCMRYMDYMALMWRIWRQQAFYCLISHLDCW